MVAAPDPDGKDPETADPSRRTSLAAERTWLAWWRTGLGASAVAIGVGRVLPGFTDGTRWPLKALGLGYAMLAIAVLLIGGVRQSRVAAALRDGRYDHLSSPVVNWLTAAAVALAFITLAVIAIAL
jgi:uncharacterized membrane protein YidH (DUF202 family)